jgi:predicted nucleic acid-binding protein
VRVLVDSSVWVDYFRTGRHAEELESLLEDGRVVINDLILAELIPALHVKRQPRLINLLHELEQEPMQPDWEELIRMQIACLRDGLNGIGIPDLLIAQNAMQHGFKLMTRDGHFVRLARHVPLQLHSSPV